jgi:hypothetical protein
MRRASETEPGERYDPLPSLPRIPGYVWQHLSPRGRGVAATLGVLLLLGVAAGVILLGPGIRSSKQERAASEQREREARRGALIERLEREQRPLSAAGPADSAPTGAQRLRRRSELLADVRASVGADARRRVRAGQLEGPILRVACEPFPRSVEGRGADEDLARRSGRYECLAVTSEIRAGATQGAGAIGHPFRVLVDFESGRYTWCKVSGRPGERAVTREPLVTVPAACGGR